jgi:deazaflavin-dependent oxidoreductase (nitroreductase family)
MPRQEEKEEVLDSPTGWVAQHVRRYVETGGRQGHRWNGLNTLLLTTRGRKSGKLRRTALIYGKEGERYLVVASNGGSKGHPAWYLNLVSEPKVEVQVAAEVFAGRARPATAAEKPPLWQKMAAIFPQYERYQKKTAREIPVVIIERA